MVTRRTEVTLFTNMDRNVVYEVIDQDINYLSCEAESCATSWVSTSNVFDTPRNGAVFMNIPEDISGC